MPLSFLVLDNNLLYNISGDSMNLPKRKPTRLKDYDYSSEGAYFITICTHNRKNLFSNIVGAIHESPENKLNSNGKIVDFI